VAFAHPDSHIDISLGPGATYEIYYEMFKLLAGKAEWQRGVATGTNDGWNVALNGEDVNVVDVTDQGIHCRPPTDDTWTDFGEPKFIGWDNIHTIIF